MKQSLNQKMAPKGSGEYVRHTITGAEAEVVGFRDGKVIVEISTAPTDHPDWFGERWLVSTAELNSFWYTVY